MTIEAKIIADSISVDGIRLTTMQLVYPRFVHAEFMTHRVFSRNASSSRAIPVAKMIEQVRTNPAMPIHWGKNQPGMQAHEELNAPVLLELPMEHDNPSDVPLFTFERTTLSPQEAWREAAARAAEVAEAMAAAGYHKQVVNRILEPFQHIHVIVTATEWDNFFALRCHPDAQPEINQLADRMAEAMGVSQPKLMVRGEWHLPYVTDEELLDASFGGVYADLRKISAARCARVSYLTHDGEKPNAEKDLALYERLVGSAPLHASPIEHQATPDVLDNHLGAGFGDSWEYPELHGNFSGWVQFRKLVEQEMYS